MIIATRVENSHGALRKVYYKYMGTHGKPMLGSKRDAAAFPPEQAAKVLSHLKTIDARFHAGELVSE